MKMKMKRFGIMSVLVAAVVASGCGTTYQSKGMTGGFSETQLDTNVWKVSFNGNGFTKQDKVRDFGLLRASELTLQNGYSYFLVMDEGDYTTQATTNNHSSTSNTNCTTGYGNNVNCQTSSNGYGPTTINRHGVERVVVMFNERPDHGVPYNAQMIYNSIRKEYGIGS